ncbi:MAG: VIT1/CCC1 transporter family protein [Candidatus Omnitrophica bacterium]|nr:VIT1/CCC1 transporter family protein [Candidatus Omnitrophota bacterium]MCM8791512.1 VIT1/CCC1 transporter family protein [Candidatus Omnitrophota bacterium]
MNDDIKRRALLFQRNEITEHYIYARLADIEKNPANRKLLRRISDDELRHYGIWKKYTGEDVGPDRFNILKYVIMARVLGLTFVLKLMEGGEENAQDVYSDISSSVAEAAQISAEEDAHEHQLLDMIDEERLKYAGSIVLGLNDALVELTGALVGLTFALGKPRLVATAGAITGIAASLSMAASEFLSTKSEGETKDPFKASVYTGIAYIITVTILILPYLLLNNLILSLCLMVISAVMIIFTFTFYISVARNLEFRKRFVEMVSISLGVAGLSFLIGLGVRAFLNIDV